MNTFTKRGAIAGPAGALSVAIDTTTDHARFAPYSTA